MAASPPQATAPPAAAPNAHTDDSPWAEIELNYFTSMRLHREKEDRDLADDHRVRGDALRQQLVDNYHAQTDLLQRLRELKTEYEAGQDRLDALDGEVTRTREARRKERELEDEERRAWFERYRRGGLAYRGGEGDREEKAQTPVAEDGRTTHRGDVNGGPPVRKQAVYEEHAIQEQAKADGRAVVDETTTQEPQPDEEMTDADGLVEASAGREPAGESSAGWEKGTPDAGSVPRERAWAEVDVSDSDAASLPDEKKDESAAGEKEVFGASTLLNGRAEEPELVERDTTDAAGGAPPNEPHGEPEAVDQDMTDTGALPIGQDKEPQAAEEKVLNTSALVNGRGQETLAVEDDTQDAPLGDDDTAMEGVEAPGGPELPTTDEQAKVGAPAAGHEAHVTEAIQQPLQEAVESPGDNHQLGAALAEDDVEMSDARTSTNETGDIDLPEPPLQTTPAAAPSPSSSSELSSRHTTPELDTPVSLPREPSPSATPEGAASDALEILDESGDLIGLLQPPDRSNSLVDSILQRPVKRPVHIRPGRKFTADDLNAVPLPRPGDSRYFKFLSFYVQATGEVQARPCSDCAMNHGLYQGCVLLDDPDFTRCGNCEWNKRRCHYAPSSRPSSSRHSLPAKSPTKARSTGGSFSTGNNAFGSQQARAQAETTADEGDNEKDKGTNAGGMKRGPRKSLPTNRKAPIPSTPPAGSFQSGSGKPNLPEINKQVLCLRDDGVVFTDPPLMRGVPLAKISPDHPYWEADWKPIEEIIEPLQQKHQEKYEQLEQSGSTHRDKHLANRDAKRGRTVFKFLEEGDLHPYQLVGKEWINYRITNYDTVFRLAQLLLEELPRMNLDVKPSEWLRHRLCEVYLEKGDKFDVASWIGKAYHDRKVEQLREKNGFPRVGRPPAHANKPAETGSSTGKKPSMMPRSLKRKDPHQTPESTPSKTRTAAAASTSRPPPSRTGSFSVAEANGAAATEQQKPKKIKIITSHHQGAGDEPTTARRSKIVLNSSFPPSAAAAAAADEDDPSSSGLEYDGYTSTDSISDDRLHPNDWRLHQVKTRTFATNPNVTQYWHWVTEEKKKDDKVIEHQVLESVEPIKWSIFKKPYNFHLKLGDIQEVSFARGSTRVLIAHKKGRDGKDMNPRGDVMAQFKRERTKRRFLTFLGREKGVKIAEVGK